MDCEGFLRTTSKQRPRWLKRPTEDRIDYSVEQVWWGKNFHCLLIQDTYSRECVPKASLVHDNRTWTETEDEETEGRPEDVASRHKVPQRAGTVVEVRPTTTVHNCRWTFHHSSGREGPSLEVIQPSHPHSRNPVVPKFEDLCQEETRKQERWARRAAWDYADEVCKIRGNLDQSMASRLRRFGLGLVTFVRLVSFCTIHDWTRRKRVCCGLRGLHAHVQQEDLNSAELETVRVSRNRTIGHHSQWRSANKRRCDQTLGFVLDGSAPRRYSANHFSWPFPRRSRFCMEWIEDQTPNLIHKWLETILDFLVFRAKLQAPVQHGRQMNFRHRVCARQPAAKSSTMDIAHMNGYHEVARCETCQNEARCETCQNGCFLPERLVGAEASASECEARVLSEPCRSVSLYRKRGSRKHNVFTHFPIGPEFRRTQTEPEITRVPCRRRTKKCHSPRSQVCRPDHGLPQNPQRRGKTRDTHRYAVIVQDLATEWTQSYQCKTKSSERKKTTRSLQTFLESNVSSKVMQTDR